MDLVDRTKMRVVYMTTGLMYVAELVNEIDGLKIKNAMAFAPNQNGMAVFEAFGFTNLNEVVTIQPTSLIAVTEVGDEVIAKQYLEALKQAKNRQSGLVLP